MTRPVLAGIEPLSVTPWTSRVAGTSNGVRVYDGKGSPLPGCFSCGENDAVYEPEDGALIAAAPDLLAAVRDLLGVADDLDAMPADATLRTCDVADLIRNVVRNHLDLTDPEGDPT